MLTLQVNLENDKLLNDSLHKIFENLPQEVINEVAEKALYNYLTDTVDYQKQQFIDDLLIKAKTKGLVDNYSSYNSKTAEQLSEMSDEQIQRLDIFTRKVNAYKSPKASMFDKIHQIMEESLKSETIKFVNTNAELSTLLEKQKKAVADDFINITKDVMSNLSFNFIMQTIDQAKMGSFAFSNVQRLENALNQQR